MPPLSSDAEPRPPGDFASVLATKEPLLLVGGQAVNLWALYYDARTSSLAPFVSRDVDVLGDQSTLTALAKLAGARPQFFPLKPPSNEVGVVIAKDSKGRPLLVEVLRHVHGISNEELRSPVYTLGVGNIRVQVPSPIALLQAKIANVADLSQSGRQDARHVLILVRLLPAYLNDFQEAVVTGRVEERQLVDTLERLLAVVTTPRARKVFAQLTVSPADLFAELGAPRLTSLNAFLTKRLPRRL